MKKDTKLEALLSLLQDDNPQVAALAMEQFLKQDKVADKMIAIHQDCHDPRLRQRIHQMSSIRGRRRIRRDFLRRVEKVRMSTWEGLRCINQLYDPQCDLEAISLKLKELCEAAGDKLKSAKEMSVFMQKQGFSVPTETSLEVELYLTDSLLEFKFGSPALLCALAQYIGRLCDGWRSTIALREGRFCLLDSQNCVLDPSRGWEVSHLDPARNLHVCSRREVWLAVLSQLFMVGLVEGNLRDIYVLGDLLTALNGEDLDSLPYPLGKQNAC